MSVLNYERAFQCRNLVKRASFSAVAMAMTALCLCLPQSAGAANLELFGHDPCAVFNLFPASPGANDEVEAPQYEGERLGLCQTIADMLAGDVVVEENQPKVALQDFGLNITASPPTSANIQKTGEYFAAITCQKGAPCDEPTGHFVRGFAANGAAEAIADAINADGTVEERAQQLLSVASQVIGDVDDAINTFAADVKQGLPLAPPPSTPPDQSTSRKSEPRNFAVEPSSSNLHPAMAIVDGPSVPVPISATLESNPTGASSAPHMVLTQADSATVAEDASKDPPKDPTQGAWSELYKVQLGFQTFCKPFLANGGIHLCTGKPGGNEGERIGGTNVTYTIYRLNTNDPDYDYFAVRARIWSSPNWLYTGFSCGSGLTIDCFWFNTKRSVWFRLDPFENAEVLELHPLRLEPSTSTITQKVGFSVGGKVSGGVKGGKPEGSAEVNFDYSTEWTEEWSASSVEQINATAPGTYQAQWYDLFRGPRDIPGFNGEMSRIFSAIQATPFVKDAIIRIQRRPLYVDKGGNLTFHYSAEGHFSGGIIPHGSPGAGTYAYPSGSSYNYVTFPLPRLDYPRDVGPILTDGKPVTFQVRLLNLRRTDWFLQVGTFQKPLTAGQKLVQLGDLPSYLRINVSHPLVPNKANEIDYNVFNVSVSVSESVPTHTLTLGVYTNPGGLTDDVRFGAVPIYLHIYNPRDFIPLPQPFPRPPGA